MDASPDYGCLKRINEMEVVSNNHVRSYPKHICGFFMSTRIFGGQTIGQGYYAFKKLYPDTTVIKNDTNFIAPGNANEPLDFFIDLDLLKSGFTKIEVKQKQKIIAYCNIRFTFNLKIPKKTLFIKIFENSEFPYGIDKPLNYRKLTKEDATGLSKKHKTDVSIFEIRPIDPGRYLFYDDSFEVAPAWTRVNPFFSDAKNGASLNHKVTIHCDSPDINPHGFFLIQTKCNTIYRQSSIIDGQIFDEKKRLILSYRQQNYSSP